MTTQGQGRRSDGAISTATTTLMAVTAGCFVANLYYAQPLAGLIATDLAMNPKTTGLVVTLSQLGYCFGLLALVPLGDLIENRRLVVAMAWLTALALAGAALAPGATAFLGASFLIGAAAVGAQVVVPFGAHFASEARRGRTVGNIMGGLMAGVMLARPAASLVAGFAGWRAVFAVSAVAMALLGLAMRASLPTRRPEVDIRYGRLIVSMFALMGREPVLRRRSAYQAFLFATFSVFWTASPLLLSSPSFGLTQSGIALFALIGVAGVVAAPFAGRMADRGLVRIGTLSALLLAAAAMVLSLLAVMLIGGKVALVLLALAGVGLDFGVTSSLVIGQRVIYALSPPYRSRLNGIFIACFFLGGAAGSALAGWAFASFGWAGAAGIGIILPLLGLAVALVAEPAG